MCTFCFIWLISIIFFFEEIANLINEIVISGRRRRRHYAMLCGATAPFWQRPSEVRSCGHQRAAVTSIKKEIHMCRYIFFQCFHVFYLFVFFWFYATRFKFLMLVSAALLLCFLLRVAVSIKCGA